VKRMEQNEYRINPLKMFTNEVKEEMKLQNINSATLALRMNMKESNLSYHLYKSGNSEIYTLHRMAEALGMKLIICLGDKDD